MKPKPFESLNHFTVPCAMYALLSRLRAATCRSEPSFLCLAPGKVAESPQQSERREIGPGNWAEYPQAIDQTESSAIEPETSPRLPVAPTAFIAVMRTFAGCLPVATTCCPGLRPPARPAMRHAMFSVECELFVLPLEVSSP